MYLYLKLEGSWVSTAQFCEVVPAPALLQPVCTCFCAQGVVYRRLRVAGWGASTAPVPAVPTQAGPRQVAPPTQARFKVTGPCKELAGEHSCPGE